MNAKRVDSTGPRAADPIGRVALRSRYKWLTGVAAIGSLDVAQFLATNTGMFSAAPGRAAGSVLGLILWLALTVLAGIAASGRRFRQLTRAVLVVAGLVAVGSVGLTAVHAAAHVGGLRPALGGVLSLVALAIAIVAVRH
ncbi:MAG TPA: hypothetical protein VMW80_10195 [Candidatus Dormibacteraeota bacterium]|nr:hypothetical protein [Candidatus Dormibacteraeota bacterium]